MSGAFDGRDIVALDRVDNAQTVPSLIIHVEAAINTYLAEHASVRSSKVRAVIWNTLPDEKTFKRYFAQYFTLLKYDDTYSDFQFKDFDYTRQTESEVSKKWEKFVFVRAKHQVITLFISYTMDSDIAGTSRLQLDEFIGLALSRMSNKLTNPSISVYNDEMPRLAGGGKIQYIFVYHDNKEGFVERRVKSFSDGTMEQEKTDKKHLSSCIVKSEKEEKTLHSIRHPIRAGYVVPNFHAHYGVIPDGIDRYDDDIL